MSNNGGIKLEQIKITLKERVSGNLLPVYIDVDDNTIIKTIAGGGGGSLKTGRFLTTKANQGDLLATLLACTGIPLDRPIGNSTKQITEMMNG